MKFTTTRQYTETAAWMRYSATTANGTVHIDKQHRQFLVTQEGTDTSEVFTTLAAAKAHATSLIG